MKIKNWNRVKEGTLLIVTWQDISEHPDWQPDEEAQMIAPLYCKTVGWFVNADKDTVRITWSVAEDGDKSVTLIPMGAIKDVQKIKYERQGL